MPLSVVQVSVNQVAGSQASIAAPVANNATGNLMVVGVRGGGPGNVSSVTDTSGNTYLPLTRFNSGGDFWQWWYSKSIQGNSANIVTANLSQSMTFTAIFAYEVAGADPTRPLDGNSNVGGNVGSGGTPQTYTSPVFSLAEANEVIFFGMNVSSTGETVTAGLIGGVLATAISSDNGGGNAIAGAEYLIVSTRQIGITAKIQMSNGAPGAFSVAAFIAANPVGIFIQDCDDYVFERNVSLIG